MTGHKAYRPRRAGKFVMREAPDYVLACHDDGGATRSRYTVFLGGRFWWPKLGRNVQYLRLSAAPGERGKRVPHGLAPSDGREAFGARVAWVELPMLVRSYVVWWATSNNREGNKQ